MPNYSRDELLKILGAHIRQVREQLGLTKTEVADRANKERQIIQKLEKGLFNPSYLFLYEIAEAMQVSFSEIVTIDHAEVLAGIKESSKKATPKKTTAKKQVKR